MVQDHVFAVCCFYKLYRLDPDCFGAVYTLTSLLILIKHFHKNDFFLILKLYVSE